MDRLLVLVGITVGGLLGLSLAQLALRRLGLRTTNPVEVGRVGDQPVIQYQERWWVAVVLVAAVLAGIAGGGFAVAAVIRNMRGP